MAKSMKVEIKTREIIRPSSLTSPENKIFDLCLLDQFAPTIYYIPLLLFYAADGGSHATVANKSHNLKSSLSKFLTRFYPFAGRLKDSASIDCNDEGVVYIEAHVNHRTLELLAQPPDVEQLEQFLPNNHDDASFEESTAPLLLVQGNLFECGGIAIGLCISHKIADAATVGTIIKSWSTLALGCGHDDDKLPVRPLFAAASLFPAKKDLKLFPLPDRSTTSNCVSRRFVFYASKISALKAKTASSSVSQPTRVEAVTALIWRCATNASRFNVGFSRISVLSTTVNIRQRTVPPMPENTIGNIVSLFLAKTDESETELQRLVALLREGKQEFRKVNWLEKFQGNDGFSVISGLVKDIGLQEKERDFYICASWCKYPLYEGDFGWGKPLWVATARSDVKNSLVLLDTKDGGGIEAWLTLSEEDMALVECDEELLTFATLNPSVI